MARMTKAERDMAEASQLAAEWSEFRSEFPNRVMKLMFGFMSAQSVGGPFSVRMDWDRPNVYQFVSHQDWDELFELYAPGTEQDWGLVTAFNNAERAVERFQEKMAEIRRVENLRRVALAKLSDEEREALGV